MNGLRCTILIGFSCAALILALSAEGTVREARAQTESRPWRFVSIPDFLNNDVDFPEPRWDDALDYVLKAVRAEDPEFVVVAGDLVMGRWSMSKDHLWKMAGIYYPAWMRRMEAAGLEYYAAVGDHEMGDDPWPPAKAMLIPDYRRAFEELLRMPSNGPPSFRRRAYSVRHENLLLLVVDVFETDRDGGMRIGVTGEQLDWVERTLKEHHDADHVVLVGHTPILSGWRARSSSRLSLPGGAEAPVWKLAAEYGVDLYLCGEIHDVSVQERDGILQIPHGSQPSNVPEFNYLVVTVFPERLELELKMIETTLEGPRDAELDPFGVDPYRERVVRMTPEQERKGVRVVGSLSIDKSGDTKRIVNRSGYFLSRYDVRDDARRPSAGEP